MTALIFIFDLALLTLATLRLSRLVTSDHIGQWFVQEPAGKWADEKWRDAGWQPPPKDDERQDLWYRLVEGIKCAFCEGYWIGIFTLTSLYLVGGPGDAAEWWRYVMGSFGLNYVVGHISARLD